MKTKIIFLMFIITALSAFRTTAQTEIKKEYGETGKLLYETPYVNGKKNGIEKKYFESGKINIETPYTDDKINGIEKEYYESGKIKSETPYTFGEKGETKLYSDN